MNSVNSLSDQREDLNNQDNQALIKNLSSQALNGDNNSVVILSVFAKDGNIEAINELINLILFNKNPVAIRCMKDLTNEGIFNAKGDLKQILGTENVEHLCSSSLGSELKQEEKGPAVPEGAVCTAEIGGHIFLKDSENKDDQKNSSQVMRDRDILLFSNNNARAAMMEESFDIKKIMKEAIDDNAEDRIDLLNSMAENNKRFAETVLSIVEQDRLLQILQLDLKCHIWAKEIQRKLEEQHNVNRSVDSFAGPEKKILRGTDPEFQCNIEDIKIKAMSGDKEAMNFLRVMVEKDNFEALEVLRNCSINEGYKWAIDIVGELVIACNEKAIRILADAANKNCAWALLQLERVLKQCDRRIIGALLNENRFSEGWSSMILYLKEKDGSLKFQLVQSLFVDVIFYAVKGDKYAIDLLKYWATDKTHHMLMPILRQLSCQCLWAKEIVDDLTKAKDEPPGSPQSSEGSQMEDDDTVSICFQDRDDELPGSLQSSEGSQMEYDILFVWHSLCPARKGDVAVITNLLGLAKDNHHSAVAILRNIVRSGNKKYIIDTLLKCAESNDEEALIYLYQMNDLESLNTLKEKASESLLAQRVLKDLLRYG